MNVAHLADAFPGLLVGMLWQTTLLFVVAWAVNRWLLKKASAQVRYWIWALVLLRFFIPVTGWISVPTSSQAIDFLYPSAQRWVVRLAYTPPETSATLMGAVLEPPTSGTVSGEVAQASPASNLDDPLQPDTEGAAGGINWRQGLFLAWCGLVLFLLGWLGAQVSRQRQVIRSAEPASPAIAEMAARIQASLGIRRPVPVLVSAQTGAPIAVGLFRPAILLPSVFYTSGLSASVVEQVLLHEFAHIRRNDLPVQAAVALLRVLFFFHPVVWWTSRNLEIERELATDDWVVTEGGSNPMKYARSLLDVAENLSAPLQGAALSMGLSESARQLKERLVRIQAHRPVRPRAWQILPMALLLLAMVAFSPVPAIEPASNSTVEVSGSALEAAAGAEAAVKGFIEALEKGDFEEAREYFLFEAPIDQEVMEALFVHFNTMIQEAGASPIQLESVALEPISGDRVFVCLWGTLPLLGENDPVPMFIVFQNDGLKWKTPFFNWLTMLEAREYSAQELGKRSVTANIIQMRFGESAYDHTLKFQRLQLEWMIKLGRAPYSYEPFASVEDQLKGQLEEQLKHQEMMLKADDWFELVLSEIKELPEEMLAEPTDDPLMFYLEAEPEDTFVVEIPYGDGTEGIFRAQRFPVMTMSSILSASAGRNLGPDSPKIELLLTRGGTQVFDRITAENLGKKLAIVFEGKVLSAPVIRDRIRGGNAQVTGRFTLDEAERIAEVLNYRERKGRQLIEMIRKGVL
ncbi:MAG: M56 family metallopeptidase [Verrucomicrobiota bacterium]|nr:M56 family metallopeptidase [Verrucomicrobiota bacterium]